MKLVNNEFDLIQFIICITDSTTIKANLFGFLFRSNVIQINQI